MLSRKGSPREVGAVPVLVLIAAMGLIGFLVVSSSVEFKDKIFSQLYPKKSSYAVSAPIDGTQPSPTPQTVSYLVKSYLVYPADKPMYPEYETAVKNYMVELQNWYKEKVGTTFNTAPLQVVRSKYDYNTMRCDLNPLDSTPPLANCLADPKRLDGNWGQYMNLAIHNGVEKWDEQTATLVFSAGGGGYAGAGKYPNDTGWAITGDWVLEPISGVANSWGIPCKYSDGWQCSGGVPKGSPAHELGHAIGLPHPDEVKFPGDHVSIMRWHGDYPTIGFLPHEIEYLKQSPFFKTKVLPTPTPAPAKRVFVSKNWVNGNINNLYGLAGADRWCQWQAGQASMGSTVWKAWLSDSTTSPVTTGRMTKHNGPYKLVNGTLVAKNWADLTDETLLNKINRDQFGALAEGIVTWTNTIANGSINSTTNNCSNWKSISGTSNSGHTGFSDSKWTKFQTDNCSTYRPLYCFEQ